MTSLPTLFVSHGAPTLALEDSPAGRFLDKLGALLPRPESILCVSAHWETASPMVSNATLPDTIHDYYGFPRELYALSYPAPGAPVLAGRVAQLLRGAGLSCGLEARGLDHGAWVPLRRAYPAADIPVTQLSIQTALGPEAHLRLGAALAPLRHEGVLVMGSGGAVHNLRAFRPNSTEVPDWAQSFDAWMAEVLERGAGAELAAYRARPDGAQAHPRDEHLLPVLVALAAAGPAARGSRIHAGFEHGALGMSCYSFS